MNVDAIAKQYSMWVNTGPFDIGMATKTALSALGEPIGLVPAYRA